MDTTLKLIGWETSWFAIRKELIKTGYRPEDIPKRLPWGKFTATGRMAVFNIYTDTAKQTVIVTRDKDMLTYEIREYVSLATPFQARPDLARGDSAI